MARLVFGSAGCLFTSIAIVLANCFSTSFSMIQGKHQEPCKFSAHTYPFFQRMNIRLSSIKGKIARLNVSMHAIKKIPPKKTCHVSTPIIKREKEPISVSRVRAAKKVRVRVAVVLSVCGDAAKFFLLGKSRGHVHVFVLTATALHSRNLSSFLLGFPLWRRNHWSVSF